MLFDQVLRRTDLKDNISLIFLGGLTRLLLGIFILLIINQSLSDIRSTLIIIGAGALWTFGLIPYIKAIAFEEASRISIMLQSTPLITLVLSWLLIDETLTLKQTIAFSIIFLANLIAALKPEVKKIKMSKALPLMLLASLMYSAADVVFKAQQQFQPSFISAMAFYMVGSGMTSLSLLIVRPYRNTIIEAIKTLSARGWLIFILSSATGTAGLASFVYALTIGKVALTTLLVGTQPLFILIMSAVCTPLIKGIIKEDYASINLAFKGIAMALVLTGLYLLE